MVSPARGRGADATTDARPALRERRGRPGGQRHPQQGARAARPTDPPAQQSPAAPRLNENPALALPRLSGIPHSLTLTLGERQGERIKLARQLLEHGIINPIPRGKDEPLGAYVSRAFQARVDELFSGAHDLDLTIAFGAVEQWWGSEADDELHAVLEFDHAYALDLTHFAARADAVHPNLLPSLLSHLQTTITPIWTPEMALNWIEGAHEYEEEEDHDEHYREQAAEELASQLGCSRDEIAEGDIEKRAAELARLSSLHGQLERQVPEAYRRAFAGLLPRERCQQIARKSGCPQLERLAAIAGELHELDKHFQGWEWNFEEGELPFVAVFSFPQTDHNDVVREMFEEQAQMAAQSDGFHPLWMCRLDEEGVKEFAAFLPVCARILTLTCEVLAILESHLLKRSLVEEP
jgi:hypothetical protein